MRLGTRIGVDVGKARIGVAKSDPQGILATPVETVQRDESNDAADVGRIFEIARENAAIEIIVGVPYSLSGAETPSTEDARAFAHHLATGVYPVRLVDERLSTVTAMSNLHASGRTVKNSRGVIDQAAAIVILEHALDIERRSGEAPGTPIVQDEVAGDRGEGQE